MDAGAHADRRLSLASCRASPGLVVEGSRAAVLATSEGW